MSQLYITKKNCHLPILIDSFTYTHHRKKLNEKKSCDNSLSYKPQFSKN